MIILDITRLTGLLIHKNKEIAMMKKIWFLNIVFILILFTAYPLNAQAQGPSPEDILDSLFSLNGFVTPTLDNDYYDSDNILSAAYNVQSSYVQLQIGRNYGAGTIYSINKKEILILTAAHIFKNYNSADSNYAIFFNGIVTDTKLIYKDQNFDMAIVSVDTSAIPAYDLMNLKSAPLSKAAFDEFEKQEQKEVFALDSEITIKPEENQIYNLYGNGTRIASSYIYGPVLNSDIMVTDFGYKMLYAKCSAHNGMSGAGVFDSKCELVGILAGGSDKDEMVALRLPDVLQALSDFEAASTNELSGK